MKDINFPVNEKIYESNLQNIITFNEKAHFNIDVEKKSNHSIQLKSKFILKENERNSIIQHNMKVIPTMMASKVRKKKFGKILFLRNQKGLDVVIQIKICA